MIPVKHLLLSELVLKKFLFLTSETDLLHICHNPIRLASLLNSSLHLQLRDWESQKAVSSSYYKNVFDDQESS